MQYISLQQNPLITIVCCLHGDELFGLDVFTYFKDRQKEYPEVALILANEEAIQQRKRYIETDLNRSFPGNTQGSHEERLAAEILPLALKSTYVLDIHNARGDLQMTPIITRMSDKVQHMVSFCNSKEVVRIHPPFSEKGLISHSNGISVEFSEEYAKTNGALQDVLTIIDGVRGCAEPFAHEQTLYHVTRTISLAEELPSDAKNFKYIPELDIYPFLLNEPSYPDIQGLAATSIECFKIT